MFIFDVAEQRSGVGKFGEECLSEASSAAAQFDSNELRESTIIIARELSIAVSYVRVMLALAGMASSNELLHGVFIQTF